MTEDPTLPPAMRAVVPGQGARNLGRCTAPPDAPGLGVVPNEDHLGEPVAVYQ